MARIRTRRRRLPDEVIPGSVPTLPCGCRPAWKRCSQAEELYARWQHWGASADREAYKGHMDAGWEAVVVAAS